MLSFNLILIAFARFGSARLSLGYYQVKGRENDKFLGMLQKAAAYFPDRRTRKKQIVVRLSLVFFSAFFGCC